MALSASTIWEVRSVTGGDTNGGGFVEGATGTDYSQQNGKNVGGVDGSTSDAVANGTTTITSATATFGTSIVGNIVYFAGGSGSITGQWRQVTARASGTSITIDASIAASTGMTMNVGGALATTNALAASAQLAVGMSIYAKGTETRSTGVTLNGVRVRGYTSARTDGGKYTYQATAGMATLFTSSGSLIENILFDGNSQTFTAPIAVIGATSTNTAFRNIEIKGVSGSALIFFFCGNGTQLYLHDCASSGYAIRGNGTPCNLDQVDVYNNPNIAGIIDQATSNLITYNVRKFVFNTNGGHGVDGGRVFPVNLYDGVIYAQTSDGINANIGFTGVPCVYMERVIIMSCAKAIALFQNTVSRFRVRAVNCFEYNNTAASTGNFEGSMTTLGGDPFVAAASGNFALSPSGANFSTLKALGFTYPRGTTVDYGAAGAAQPQAASAGLVRVGFDGGYDG